MRLLLTNDDGHRAPGLNALAAALSVDHEVVVVAPDRELSGISHAITLTEPIAIRALNGREVGTGWAVKGTPADCVKLAFWRLLADNRPDLVVAGINRGANVGLNLLYSGTVAAAREASLLGLRAVAFSLDSHSPTADFGPAARLARRIVDLILKSELPAGLALNVNFPVAEELDLAMCRLTKQSLAAPRENFIGRHDPRGNDYFWQDQEVYDQPLDPDSDLAVLRRGLVSITPLRFDLTAHGDLADLPAKLGL